VTKHKSLNFLKPLVVLLLFVRPVLPLDFCSVSFFHLFSASNRLVDPSIVAVDPGEDVRKSGLGTSGPERGQPGQIPAAVLHVAVKRSSAVTLKTSITNFAMEKKRKKILFMKKAPQLHRKCLL
jgi:hypothetical protein